jgi:hypothetical protein
MDPASNEQEESPSRQISSTNWRKFVIKFFMIKVVRCELWDKGNLIGASFLGVK